MDHQQGSEVERQDVTEMEHIPGEQVGVDETAVEPLDGPGFGHREAEADPTEAENGSSTEHTEREESTAMADATTGMESNPRGKGGEEADPDHRAKFLETLLSRISDLEKPAPPGPLGALPPRVTGPSLPPFDWQTYDPKNERARRKGKDVSRSEGEMTGWMRRWMMRPPYGGLDALPPGGANSHPEFPPGRDHGLTAREAAWFDTMHRRAQERQRLEGAARRGLGEGLGARQGVRAGLGANGANPRAGPGSVKPEDRLNGEDERQEAEEGFLFADSAEEELGGRGGFVGGPERGQTECDVHLEIRMRRPARPRRDPREFKDLSDCEVMEWQRRFNREMEAQGLGGGLAEAPREPPNVSRAMRERRERRVSEKAAGACGSWGEDLSVVSGQGSRVRPGKGGMLDRPESPPTNPRQRPRGGPCFLGPESEDELFGYGARLGNRGLDRDRSKFEDSRRRAMLEHRERERRGRVNSASENRGGAGVAGGPAGEPGDDDDSSDDDSGEEDEFPGHGNQGFGEQVPEEQGLGDQHAERPSVNASGEQGLEVQGSRDQVLGGRGLEGQGFPGLEPEKQRPGGPSLRDQPFTSLEGDQDLERQDFCGLDLGRGFGDRSLGSSGLEGRDFTSWDWEEQDQGSQGVRMQNSGGKGSGSNRVEILDVESGELDRGSDGLGAENAGLDRGLGGLGVENGGSGGHLIDQGLAETGQEHRTPILEDWGYESPGALDLDQEDWSGRFNTAGLNVPGGRGAVLEGGLKVPPQPDVNGQLLLDDAGGDSVRAVRASQDGPEVANAFDAAPDTSAFGKSRSPPASARRTDALMSATARNVNRLPGAGQSMSGASPLAEAGGAVRGADVNMTLSPVGADEAFEEVDAFVREGEPQAEPRGAALDGDASLAPSEQQKCQAEALGGSVGGSASPAATRWSFNFQQEMENMRRQTSPIRDLEGLRSFSQSQKSFFRSQKESDDAKAEREGGKGTAGPNLSAGEEGWLKWKACAGSVSGKSPGKKRVKMLDHGKG
jgi:hypothetical protein